MKKFTARALVWSSVFVLGFSCAKVEGEPSKEADADADADEGGDGDSVLSGTGGRTSPSSSGGASAGSGGSIATLSGGAQGSGGKHSIDPGVIENADLLVRATFEPQNFHFFLENKGEVPLPLGSLEVRYWYQSETAATTLHNYYTGSAITPVTWVAAEAEGEKYASATFAAGNLAVNEGNYAATEFQLQLNYGAHDATNDWSYATDLGNFGITDRVTAYLEDKLIWGCEPLGECAGGGGMGGGGGQGGAEN